MPNMTMTFHTLRILIQHKLSQNATSKAFKSLVKINLILDSNYEKIYLDLGEDLLNSFKE